MTTRGRRAAYSSVAERQPPDPRAAGRVAGCVQIDAVELRSSFFQINDEDPGDVTRFHTEWYATVNTVDDEMLRLGVGFRLRDHRHEGGDHDEDDFEDQAVMAFSDYVVTYRISEGADIAPDDLPSFADINGVFNCWPYWRQLVQSMFATMGLPPLLVPVFRVPLSANTSTTTKAVAKAPASGARKRTTVEVAKPGKPASTTSRKKPAKKSPSKPRKSG